MTKIIYSLSADNFKMHLTGHAKPGKLCAAISVLAQVLIQNLYEQDANIDYSIKSGEIDIKLDKPNRDAQMLIKGAVTGFEWLRSSYPEQVNIEIGA